MSEKKIFKGGKLSDNVKAGALRWWLMGMCYFMIGFGTQAGLADNPLDLIVLLSIATGLVTVYIYNPIAYSTFKIVRRGQIQNTVYRSRVGWRKALSNLAEVGKSFLVVLLVYLSYQSVNTVIVRLGGLEEGTVLIPGEPFGFATLYIIFYFVLTGFVDRIQVLRSENKEAAV